MWRGFTVSSWAYVESSVILTKACMSAHCATTRYKKPVDSQREYIEKENRLAGQHHTKASHTVRPVSHNRSREMKRNPDPECLTRLQRWFNKYCSGGRINKTPPPFDASGLKQKDRDWLERFDRLKFYDEKMERGCEYLPPSLFGRSAR